jgi:hypothetical protein
VGHDVFADMPVSAVSLSKPAAEAALEEMIGAFDCKSTLISCPTPVLLIFVSVSGAGKASEKVVAEVHAEVSS